MYVYIYIYDDDVESHGFDLPMFFLKGGSLQVSRKQEQVSDEPERECQHQSCHVVVSARTDRYVSMWRFLK